MKLAEALLARKELQVRANELVERGVASARFQEGETPAENASALVVAASAAYQELAELVAKINQTNASYVLENGKTLTRALAERESLARRRAMLTRVADGASGKNDHWGGRQMRSELRWETAVPVTELRDQSNHLARDHRELDAVIQQANWAADLEE